MESEKRNQIIIVSIILVLLLVVISFIIYSLFINKKNNDNKIAVKFQQVYSSDYRLSNLDDNYFIGTYDEGNKIDVIIDKNGTEIVKNTEGVFYDEIYKMKDGNYLIYDNHDNILNIWIFNGTSIEMKQSISNVPYVKPILFVSDSSSYIVGFACLIENNLYLYNLDSEKPVILGNKSIMGDQVVEGVYYTYNEKYLVIKDNDGLMGVIDFKGNQVIDYKYKNIVNTYNNSFIAVSNKNKYGIIDNQDNALVKFKYNVIAPFNDYFLVVDSKNKMALFNNEYKEIIGFKMNYDSLLDYDFRSKFNSISLYKLGDKIIVLNNFMELNNGTEFDKHNLYIIEDNKIVDNISQMGFGCQNEIYTLHDNGVVKIYDENLEDYFEINVDDILKFIDVIKVSENVYEVDYFNQKEEFKKKFFNREGNRIDFNYGEIKVKDSDYNVFLNKEDNMSVLSIYDNNYEKIDELKGNYIDVKSEFIIVDNSIYKIVKDKEG